MYYVCNDKKCSFDYQSLIYFQKTGLLQSFLFYHIELKLLTFISQSLLRAQIIYLLFLKTQHARACKSCSKMTFKLSIHFLFYFHSKRKLLISNGYPSFFLLMVDIVRLLSLVAHRFGRVEFGIFVIVFLRQAQLKK